MEIIRSHPKNHHHRRIPIDAHPLSHRPVPRDPPRRVRALRRRSPPWELPNALSRGRKPEEMEKLVSELWKTNMKHQDPAEAARKDGISHFVLRLAYCMTADLRKWFLSMETTLFRYRFRLESPDSQRVLMTEFNLPYKALGHAEYEAVKDKLVQVARSTG